MFPAYGLLVGAGADGLHQNGWVPALAAVVAFGCGLLIVALVQLARQRASRARPE